METPDITAAQKGVAASAATLTVAIIASPASDLVKCFALVVTGLVSVAVIIADAIIRKGRAGIAEAAQYAQVADESE